ncbi:DUF2789 domain-containing protein [Corallincola holothuriorum]|uniref:DUF2789 domain-containing protein n=1 Tax=Corallincola holothuriorum TaxID=2282215 RepID=A0A368NDY5_9GAMM|nr:DUF2789 domain-containing protein [Corallincola holothuriorum]RCU48857.1 DUF2789 domain-containing protein [Corallincola holothuriorum]
MDTSTHNLSNLFAQLGLASDPASLKDFIIAHSLNPEQKLADAPFWNASQATFLSEALSEDSDWTEIVDQLDSMLRADVKA